MQSEPLKITSPGEPFWIKYLHLTKTKQERETEKLYWSSHVLPNKNIQYRLSNYPQAVEFEGRSWKRVKKPEKEKKKKSKQENEAARIFKNSFS